MTRRALPRPRRRRARRSAARRSAAGQRSTRSPTSSANRISAPIAQSGRTRIIALQDFVEQLGVDVNPRDARGDRGRLQIVDDAGSRSPDQHDMAGEQCRIEFAASTIGGGDRAVGLDRRIMQPNPSGGVGRHRQRPDADRRQAGILAKILFAVGAGGAADIGRGAKREAQRLGGERRIGLAVRICRISGTRRTTLSHSGSWLRNPSPAAAASNTGNVGTAPAKIVDMAERIARR